MSYDLTRFTWALGENTTEYDGQSIITWMTEHARRIVTHPYWSTGYNPTRNMQRLLETNEQRIDIFTFSTASPQNPVKVRENRLHYRSRVSIGAWDRIRGGSAMDMLADSLSKMEEETDQFSPSVYRGLSERVFGVTGMYCGYQAEDARKEIIEAMRKEGWRIKRRQADDKRMTVAERARLKKRADCEAKLKVAGRHVENVHDQLQHTLTEFYGNVQYYVRLMQTAASVGVDP
jgi:hypothetical protein